MSDKKNTGGGDVQQTGKLPAQSKMAKMIIPSLENIAYDDVRDDWMIYAGHWESVAKRRALKVISEQVEAILDRYELGYSSSYLNGVASLIEMEVSHSDWDSQAGVIPFQNGLLDLNTRKMRAHRRDDRITWRVPYDYKHDATAEPILSWLLESVGGLEDRAIVLLAFMRAIVTGRTDLQRYLELIGPGGTGKSTFIRICEMLVGAKNVHSTELKHLENNRFETANLYGKRLIIVTDSQNYAGDVSALKAITGQDTLRYEEKNKQGGRGFRAQGMVIIAANEPISSKDYTSGIARRRITMPFTNMVKASARRDLEREFAPFIPGLLNTVLGMSDADMSAILRDTDEHAPSLNTAARDTLTATNPLAQWLDECIVYDPESETYVGDARKDSGGNMEIARKLYPSYVDFCTNYQLKPLALNRFVMLLHELCNSQLGLNVQRKRKADGRVFTGLAIKEFNDSRQNPLSLRFGNSELS